MLAEHVSISVTIRFLCADKAPRQPSRSWFSTKDQQPQHPALQKWLDHVVKHPGNCKVTWVCDPCPGGPPQKWTSDIRSGIHQTVHPQCKGQQPQQTGPRIQKWWEPASRASHLSNSNGRVTWVCDQCPGGRHEGTADAKSSIH